MKLLIGTANPGKAIEIASLLNALGVELILPSMLSISDKPDEPYDSLRENARHKAQFYFDRSGGIPTVSEDTGLFVEGLKNELGVKTRRWGAGEHVSDQEWIDFFLKRMENIENRTAKFLCTVAYIDADKQEHFFDGEFGGVITQTLEHPITPGLPVCGCFRPNGFDSVYAALTLDEKNAISHRGQAVAKLRDFIRSLPQEA